MDIAYLYVESYAISQYLSVYGPYIGIVSLSNYPCYGPIPGPQKYVKEWPGPPIEDQKTDLLHTLRVQRVYILLWNFI